PTHRSIVREIRLALGLSQDELAARMGTSAGTINKIENGAMTISRRLALRLSWLSGVPWKPIAVNHPGRPMTALGPLDRSHARRKTEQLRNLPETELEERIRYACYNLEVLLLACQSKAPQKFEALEAATMVGQQDWVEEFSLSAAVKMIEKEMVSGERK